METPAPHPDHIPENHSVKKQVLVSVLILSLLVGATVLFILYGKGYRFDFQKGEPKIAKTGLLQVDSTPVGAQVYINDHLTTATDDDINLTPGKYKVKIAKDGYNDWQKDVEITKEVVTSIDATLWPKAPTLQSISTFGVESVVADPSGTKLAFKIASNSAKRNGIYLFDMTARTFPVLAGQSNSTQLVDDTTDVFSTAEITWSPDGKQILASTSGSASSPTYYLLKTDTFNATPQDVTATLLGFMDLWDTQKKDKAAARLKSLKPAVQKFAQSNFKIISWSPDDSRILYQASESAEMPIFLTPRRIGNNLLYERRDLEKDAIYVYDLKEDVNTRVSEPMENPELFTWFPDSRHVLLVHDKQIDIIDDDGANKTTLYGGPFIDHYAYPWPDGSKIVILTNLGNQNTSPTLYTIALK